MISELDDQEPVTVISYIHSTGARFDQSPLEALRHLSLLVNPEARDFIREMPARSADPEPTPKPNPPITSADWTFAEFERRV